MEEDESMRSRRVRVERVPSAPVTGALCLAGLLLVILAWRLSQLEIVGLLGHIPWWWVDTPDVALALGLWSFTAWRLLDGRRGAVAVMDESARSARIATGKYAGEWVVSRQGQRRLSSPTLLALVLTGLNLALAAIWTDTVLTGWAQGIGANWAIEVQVLCALLCTASFLPSAWIKRRLPWYVRLHGPTGRARLIVHWADGN